MGSATNCLDCGGLNTAVEVEGEGVLVCSVCGTVIEHGDLRGEVEVVSTHGGLRPSGALVSALCGARGSSLLPPRLRYAKSDYAKSVVLQQCTKMKATLHLPEAYESQLILLVQRAMDGIWHVGHKGAMMVAACAYIICRQNGFPLTMLDIANSEQCEVFELGRYYGEIARRLGIHLPEIDPALYLEKACGKLDLSTTEQRNVTQFAIRLINVAKDDWLVTGRTPSAVTAAAILLSLEYLGLKVDKEKVPSSLGVSRMTTKTRLRELKKTFVQLGKKLLPWGDDVNQRNLLKNLPSILQQLDFRQKVKENQGNEDVKDVVDIKLPPSYVKSCDQRQRRMEKMQRAKARIQHYMKSSDVVSKALAHLPVAVKQEEDEHAISYPDLNGPLDQEDLIIEKLFLKGEDEAVILEGYYDSLQQSGESSRESEEPELGEHDIPDSALNQFIRTPEEVEVMKAVSTVFREEDWMSVRRKRLRGK